MQFKQYYVYILAGDSGALYIGMTNGLVRRALEHREHAVEGFTAKYKISRLVYFEETSDVLSAIQREKQLKKWNRGWKMRLIASVNPGWKDLFEEIQ